MKTLELLATDGDRGVSPVIGTVLLVSIVVLLAATAMVMAGGFQSKLSGPVPETAITFEKTDAGLVASPANIGQDVDVTINGYKIGSFSEKDAGKTLYLPVTPGDTVNVRASNDERQILLRKDVEKGNAGDFISYYAFDGSGSTLTDGSMNDNDGTVTGDPQSVTVGSRTGYRFDGVGDSFLIPSLQNKKTENVEEFTIATTFRLQGDPTGSVYQIAEHSYHSSYHKWALETNPGTSDTYTLDFAVKWPYHQIVSGPLKRGTVYTAVGTYDGDSFELFIDGKSVGSKSFDLPVNMGEMTIGRDHTPWINQYFDGEIFEFRMYYTALDDDEVQSLSDTMAAEAAEQ